MCFSVSEPHTVALIDVGIIRERVVLFVGIRTARKYTCMLLENDRLQDVAGYVLIAMTF